MARPTGLTADANHHTAWQFSHRETFMHPRRRCRYAAAVPQKKAESQRPGRNERSTDARASSCLHADCLMPAIAPALPLLRLPIPGSPRELKGKSNLDTRDSSRTKRFAPGRQLHSDAHKWKKECVRDSIPLTAPSYTYWFRRNRVGN